MKAVMVLTIGFALVMIATGVVQAVCQ